MHSGGHETDLVDRWTACSQTRDGAPLVIDPASVALAHAVEISLDRGRPTTNLGELARAWGATLTCAAAAVASVSALREAAALDAHSHDAHSDVIPEGVLRILDTVLSEAVEGVSASLREAALVDPLTSCANRRALDDDLERALASSRRTGLDLSVVVIDLDGLKQINDTQGHSAGDETLRQLASALRAAVRDTDAVYRVGGDEFVVLIPFSGASGAVAAMHRAAHSGAPAFTWGAASLGMLPHGCTPAQLIDLADASLYAKRRRIRPPVTGSRPRNRNRRVLIAAAATATIGIAASSTYVLVFSPGRAAVDNPATAAPKTTLPERPSATPLPVRPASPAQRDTAKSNRAGVPARGTSALPQVQQAPQARDHGTQDLARLRPRTPRPRPVGAPTRRAERRPHEHHGYLARAPGGDRDVSHLPACHRHVARIADGRPACGQRGRSAPRRTRRQLSQLS